MKQRLAAITAGATVFGTTYLEGLLSILLPGMVASSVVEAQPDDTCLLQSTGRRATLTVGQPWGGRTPSTQVVCIGSHGGVDGDWLATQMSNREAFSIT